LQADRPAVIISATRGNSAILFMASILLKARIIFKGANDWRGWRERNSTFTKVLKYPHALFLVRDSDGRIDVLPIDRARMLLYARRARVPNLLGNTRGF